MAERGVSSPGVPERTPASGKRSGCAPGPGAATKGRARTCWDPEDREEGLGVGGLRLGLFGGRGVLGFQGDLLQGTTAGCLEQDTPTLGLLEKGLGSAGSTCSAGRRCAKGGAASYLLCASSTVEPEAGLCVPCGSVCPSTTAAQSTAPAPARPGPARPGRSTPRQGEGRWARGLGWAGRPLKLGALGSGRASSPS